MLLGCGVLFFSGAGAFCLLVLELIFYVIIYKLELYFSPLGLFLSYLKSVLKLFGKKNNLGFFFPEYIFKYFNVNQHEAAYC